jgi:hypothetical protein
MMTMKQTPSRWRVVEMRQFKNPSQKVIASLEDRWNDWQPVIMVFEPGQEPEKTYTWASNNKPCPARFHPEIDRALLTYLTSKTTIVASR